MSGKSLVALIVMLVPALARPGSTAAQNVVINEIHYNPPGDDGTVLLEFVELYNADVSTIGLAGWELDFGPQPYVFPSGVALTPGEYVVVADSATALFNATGYATPFEWGGTNGLLTSLGNGSDDVVLRDGVEGASTVIDMVSYDDDPPWPTAPDGDGPSLELINPTLDNALYSSWQPSLNTNGTPGAINSVYTEAPVIIATTPAHRTAVASAATVSVVFNAPVTGVTAGDLSVNGSAATQVMPASGPADTYTFSGFAAPSPGPTSFALASGVIEGGGLPFAGDSWTASVGLIVVINEIHYHPLDPYADAEFLEIYNAGTNGADLANWIVSDGLDMTFPPGTTLAPGEYLVAALNPALLQTVTGYVGALPWQGGRLANTGERLALADADGNELDVVVFGDGGAWDSGADGDGPSLELINPLLPNGYGPAWAASLSDHGTPGALNSVYDATPAPIIVNPLHAPAIPAALAPVTISALVLDDASNPTVTLYHRQDADPTVAYSATPMHDAGTNGDLTAGDGIYTAVVAGLPDGERLDFTIRADDGTGVSAAPPGHDDLNAGGYPAQTYLCKFSDAALRFDQPQYHLITTQRTRNLQATRNKVEYDATFIRCQPDGSCEIHYNIIERYRGASSLNQDPPSFRFNFPASAPLESEMGFAITGLNLMGQQPARQALGYGFFEAAGHPSPRNQLVYLNTNPLADGGTQDFLYINVERIDDDFIASQNGQVVPLRFPNRCSLSDAACDGPADCPVGEACLPTTDGNVYRGRHNDAEFLWEGFDPAAYMVNSFERNGYQLITNEDNHDWTDLINLCDAMNCSSTDGGLLCTEDHYDGWYPQNLATYAEVDQWAEWFAVHMVLNNVEGGIYRETGDDFFIYFRPTLDHAVFLPWDMDAILPATQETIWRTNLNGGVPVIGRFLRHNAFAGRFVQAICNLLDNQFTQAAMDARIDALPDAAFPTGTPQGNGPQTKAGMKAWVTARRNFILNEIVTQLTVNGVPASPYTNPYPVIALSGQLNQCGTHSVLVNGQPADTFSVYAATWSRDFVLVPGPNPIVVQCLDHLGQEIERVETTVDYQPPPADLRLTVPTRMINDKTLTLKAELLDAGGNINWHTWNLLGSVSAERVSDGSPVPISITVFETLNAGTGRGVPPADSIRLYNGVGSVSLTLDNGAAEAAGDILVTVDVAGLSASRVVTVLDAAAPNLFRPLAGALAGADLLWGPADGVIHLTGDVTVGAADTLTILPGTLVMVDSGSPNAGVAILVQGGAVQAVGTPLEPIFFFPTAGAAAMTLPQNTANNDASWRGFYHSGSGTSEYRHVFVTGAGNAVVSSHPRPPIFHLANGYNLNMDDCVLADCPGMGIQAISGASGSYNLRTSLFSRLGIGGEWLGTGYALTIEDCWFTRIGRAPEPSGVDGDILHVDRPGNSIILRRSILTDCGDDLIDHSSGAAPMIEDCIIYDARDKCVSLDGSSGATVTLHNCLVFDTPTGIRSSGATVHLDQTTISAPITSPSLLSTINNSIIWPNTYDSCVGTVNYALLGAGSNLACGVGNFSTDPLWLDPAACNYNLHPLSPAVSAGSNGERIGWLGFPTGSTCATDFDCADDDPCTADACNNGACVNAPVPDCISCVTDGDCDDGNPCTDDICDPLLGCQYPTNAASCDDGIACTDGDVCSNGACLGVDACPDGATCNLVSESCEFNQTLVFQQGQDGYAGTEDTFIQESAPTTSNGTAETLEWDSDDPPDSDLRTYLLLRFGILFASEGGPIPDGTTVTGATLTYTIDGPQSPIGDDGALHEVWTPWDEATTYDSFGGEPGVQPDEYDAAMVASASGGLPAATGPVTVQLDVTASLQAWSATPADNLGWIVLPLDTNGVKVVASEYLADPTRRPKLSVSFIGVIVCDDANACTADSVTTNGCVFTPLYDAQSECCDPTDGTIALLDDGDPCTSDTCGSNGLAMHSNLPDCDSDGFCDAVDNCPTLANADQLNTDGDAHGDACDGLFDGDHDGDVDLADLVTFLGCQTSPGTEAGVACQDTFDADGDLDVDLLDFAEWQVTFTGSLTSPCE